MVNFFLDFFLVKDLFVVIKYFIFYFSFNKWIFFNWRLRYLNLKEWRRKIMIFKGFYENYKSEFKVFYVGK